MTVFVSGTKLFPKVHHSFRWPGFKFQTNHRYYMYDSGQIFPSLWTLVSLCKSKREWLYFAISDITYNSKILWTFAFKFPKLFVACPSKPTAFEIRYVVLHFFFILFYFIFKLYIIVLVLPNIKMNPPQVYMCYPSWTLYEIKVSGIDLIK